MLEPIDLVTAGYVVWIIAGVAFGVYAMWKG